MINLDMDRAMICLRFGVNFRIMLCEILYMVRVVIMVRMRNLSAL